MQGTRHDTLAFTGKWGIKQKISFLSSSGKGGLGMDGGGGGGRVEWSVRVVV